MTVYKTVKKLSVISDGFFLKFSTYAIAYTLDTNSTPERSNDSPSYKM